VLAGYTLGGADLLRRAMGKKKAEEMAEQRSVFVSGATERGVPDGQATHIFDLMEKFAGYGFNKSHSAAYAVLTYQTAWLKAHYPAAFLAAVLSCDMDKTDKVVVGIDDCREMGIEVLPPDVNVSQYRFTVAGERSIRYGLGAVKGVGQHAVEAIVAARDAGGPFKDLYDLCGRIELTHVNRRCLEALLRAGATDALGPNRATLMAELPSAIQAGEQRSSAAMTGQEDLFSLGGPASAPTTGRPPGAVPSVLAEWPAATRLAGERETLGLYLSGHPLDEYRHDLKYLAPASIADVTPPRQGSGERSFTPQRNVTVAGLVLDIRRRGNRTSLILDDGSGRIEVSLFEDVLNQFRELVVKDQILLVEGGLRWDDFIEGWRLGAKQLTSLTTAREERARRLLLRWPAGVEGATLLGALNATLEPVRGGRCGVAVYYPGAAANALLELGAGWTIRPTRSVLEELGRHFGEEGVRLVYHPRDQQEFLTRWGARGPVETRPLK
jgi:DNA polymerase-3 subunit alpha